MFYVLTTVNFCEYYFAHPYVKYLQYGRKKHGGNKDNYTSVAYDLVKEVILQRNRKSRVAQGKETEKENKLYQLERSRNGCDSGSEMWHIPGVDRLFGEGVAESGGGRVTGKIPARTGGRAMTAGQG